MSLYEIEIRFTRTVIEVGTVWISAANEETALRLADEEQKMGNVSFDDNSSDYIDNPDMAILSVSADELAS